MLRTATALLLLAAGARAAGPTADLARRMIDAGLDADACYHVRDLHLSRGDVRLYFNDGYLIFGKPIDGVRLTAAFAASDEGGDAEVLLMPPSRSERLSLSSFAKSPNLNEHFRKAMFVFSDDTFAEIEGRLRQRGEPRMAPDRGILMAQEWENVARNFTRSFQVRLVRDLFGDRASYGMLYGAINGVTLGNFDIFYDPRSAEQITVGQIASDQERTFFNIWTRFPTRAFRQGRHSLPSPDVVIKAYRIEATLEPSLLMNVVSTATVSPGPEGKRALSFDISPQMRVSEALIDGVPAEVFQPESVRSTMIRGTANETFLVVPAKPLEPGREYEIVFKHSGNVVSDAGNKVYYVGSRGVWYPNRYPQFARYDMTFRYPVGMDLVATGKAEEVQTEGEWRISRHRTDAPVRLAGFNLGEYDKETVNRGGYSIDVYANRNVETALAQPQRRIVMLPPQLPTPPGRQAPPRWTVDIQPVPIDLGSRGSRLHQLAMEIANALEFMSGYFGPPVLKHLTVSPIPGGFGQGFPGLIYLSTMAYLDPSRRPELARDDYARTFYTEILYAHETAHQWWGNIVTSAQDEDDWLMEALANYSALLHLEKRKGARPLESVLSIYRDHLLAKDREGTTIESAGPIVWGQRLVTAQAPIAWRIITYEKGSWIMHMLRHRMGDARFLGMLGQLRKRYQYKGVSTEEFRKLAAEFLPPRSPDPDLQAFFEQFVYSTGIPSLKLDYSVKGSAPQVRVTGTITQSGVDPDFSTYVPVEIQFAKAKPIVHWVRTSSDPTPFTVTLKQAPSKVVLDPAGSILKK
jgi:hypothetical protein